MSTTWIAARFNIDVDEFDAALANARAASNDELAARWLEVAVGLYQGEYLGNLYYDWLFPERRRLSQEYLGPLRQLADYHFSCERYTRALGSYFTVPCAWITWWKTCTAR